MKISKEKETVLKFVEAINTADIDKIGDLMSEDHIFIDSGDGKYQGRDFMKQGWIGYFSMFPDYKIEVIDIIESGAMIGIFGYASGTYKGLKDEMNSHYFRVPASWKAIVKDGKIKHWQVYCETKKAEEIVEKNK
jgi:ketosteroid isomerase-like protein